MSKRNRSNVSAVVAVSAIALATIFLGLLIWDVSQSQAENRVRAERYATQYADETQQRIIEACTDANTVAKCAAGIVVAQHEEQRAEADLAAQRDMAKYALAMILVTIVSIIIGVIGVYFVWRTLKATREGNTIGRRIGEAQVRAYMSVTGSKAEIVRDDDGSNGYTVKLTFTFANNGSSPAIRFRWGAKIAFAYLGSVCDVRGVGLVTPEPEGFDIPANVGKAQMWLTRPEFRLTAEDVKAWRLGKLRIYVDVSTVFRDVFGTEIPHAEFFRGDFLPRMSEVTNVKLEYAKGTSSIPLYLDELRGGAETFDQRRRGRLSRRVETGPVKADDEGDS